MPADIMLIFADFFCGSLAHYCMQKKRKKKLSKIVLYLKW